MSHFKKDMNGIPLIASKSIGKKYGRLTVISFYETYKINGRTKHKLICECDCGRMSIVDSNNLFTNHTTSCGCFGEEQVKKANTVHGMGDTKEYDIWYAMISRCHDSRHPKYKNYGGKNIRVCDGWKNDFLSFHKDMGIRPKGLTLERKNNSLGYNCGHCEYCKENCFSSNVKWATRWEQDRNKSTTRLFAYDGDIMVAGDWAIKYNFSSPRALYQRLVRGWEMKKAIETPLNKYTKCRC